mmetsp:Transcript_16362/g.37538  ORF Transcript_16362/g.37538 Transcript_16362/m.37538 type:complete len:236 (-) Transcript_16362:90-797(-)
MPREDSSTPTWDGSSSRRILPLSKPDAKWTFPIFSPTPLSTGSESSILGGLFTCALSCQPRSLRSTGARISGPPSSSLEPSDTLLFFTSLGASTLPLTCTVTTRTMFFPTPPRTPSFRSAPLERDGTTGTTSTLSTTPRPNSESLPSSTPASCSLTRWPLSVLSGDEREERPHGKWDGNDESGTLTLEFPFPLLLHDHGRSRHARSSSKPAPPFVVLCLNQATASKRATHMCIIR